MPLWSLITPLAAAALLALSVALPQAIAPGAVSAIALVGAVIAAVHHAELIAHRVGEPFGTLVLALAVTVIEVALIVSMMLAGGPDKAPPLPRDTIFSTLMIICNGVVGLCLVVGSLRHHEQVFRSEGANAGLAALIAMATLTLVLPTFTTSSAWADLHHPATGLRGHDVVGPVVACSSSCRPKRHRDYFLPLDPASDADAHAPPPSSRAAWASGALLLLALLSVVGLARVQPLRVGVMAWGTLAATMVVLLVLMAFYGGAPAQSVGDGAPSLNLVRLSMRLQLRRAHSDGGWRLAGHRFPIGGDTASAGPRAGCHLAGHGYSWLVVHSRWTCGGLSTIDVSLFVRRRFK